MLGTQLDASFGPTTLMLAAFAGSFILDIWIFSLLVRSTWSAHLSRRIGRARARALGMRARFIAPAGILTGGSVVALRGLLPSGLPVKIFVPSASRSSLSYSDLQALLEQE